MFGSDDFKNYMKNAHTLETSSRVIAEWNMNIPGNILKVGNYEVRNGAVVENRPNATDCNTVVKTQYYQDNAATPTAFIDKKKKMELLYSLDECVTPHRPRSGINKPLYLGYTSADTVSSQYINNYGPDVNKRPRYYMASRFDSFKYWTSYRVDTTGIERGVSKEDRTIDDVAPYVMYNNPVPANRIVIKMQTNVGDVNLGPYRFGDDTMDDPLYGEDNATVPSLWDVQVHVNGAWTTIANLTSNDILTDGHVELGLGTSLGKDVYIKGTMPTTNSLPNAAKEGDAYWIQSTRSYYVYRRPMWVEEAPSQNWTVVSTSMNDDSPVVHNLVKNADTELELQYISGIRVVVYVMNQPNQTFDLIEMSPRLVADITDRAHSYNISKILGDLGNSTLPIGKLLASTGTIEINNNDGAFSYENKDSVLCITKTVGSDTTIVDTVLHTKMKVTFYDIVKGAIISRVTGLGDIVEEPQNIHIPIKTLYSSGFPQSSGAFDQISMSLRDAYDILEQEQAPELFLQDISMSFAVVMLLDYIGFTNVKFFRLDGEQDDIIPYFFVSPGKNVAEILQEIATATQSVMWFNEKNDLCIGTRGWVLSEQRNPSGVMRADHSPDGLANIISIASNEKRVVNDGSVTYTERYIQREYSALKQAYNTEEWRTWTYKPVMLWEVSPDSLLKEYNTTAKDGSTYTLSAIPLSVDLTAETPKVVGGKIVNNVIEFGEGISWLGRANGYFYSNGEIIRFDAMEFAISGTGVRWITSNDEYQNYLAKLPFGGKLYATGRVRIYVEPTYDSQGRYVDVRAHGRGQFGTKVTGHKAGLDGYWINDTNCYGMQMNSSYLFSADHIRKYPLNMSNVNTVMSDEVQLNARSSTRTGVIKNFLADTYQVERENERFNTTNRGTVQSSAFVFQGPKEFLARGTNQSRVADNISYVLKDLGTDAPYHHFGTRMRIIGEIVSGSNTTQKAIGAGEYVTLQPDNPSQSVNIVGGGGGIGIQVNPSTSEGYFFELAALSEETNPRTTANPVFNSTAVLVKDRGTTKVTISTGVEHNIDQGDRFVVTYDGIDAGLQMLAGEWTAEGVDKKAGKITLRIDGEADYNGADNIKVQKIGEGAATMSSVFFYKMMEKDGEVIPFVLWEGIAEILVDDGKFTDLQRVVGQAKTTVYDMSVEFKDKTEKRTFFLYLNGKQIATVDDDNPIERPRNTVAMFTRGKSRCMFNNIYALTERISENPAAVAADSIAEVFGIDSITQTEALRKYGVSGFVQQAYLSGIKSEGATDYQMYFDEFGTIMREAAYINAKYDQAFPALAATIAPTMNNTKSYTVSGFIAGAYGAEFLVFNNTDTAITLDAESGNFLRILGVAFTQDTTRTLTVDDYYGKVGDLSNIPASDDENFDPVKYRELYNKIITSRSKYGKREFESITSDYIQDSALSENILGWVTAKTMYPRQLVGIELFGMPHIELGDIFTIDYKVLDGVDAVTDDEKKFVVYHVDYTKDHNGSGMTAYLVEV